MNPDAQAQLDMADMMLSEPDPEKRRAYLAAYAGRPQRKITMPADPNDFLMGAPASETEDDDSEFFTARYDGRCSACDEYHVCAGVTQIRSDDLGGWEAEECVW